MTHDTTTKANESGPMARRAHRPSSWQMFHATPVSRVLRMGTFVAVLAGGGFWLAYDRSAAQIGEGLLSTGETLLDYAETTPSSGPRVLRLNGEAVHVQSGSTDRNVEELLGWFEAECLEQDAQLMEQLAETEARSTVDDGRDLTLFSPVLRNENEHGGVVACLDMGTERRTYSELLDAYTRFRENHDIHELGGIRYLYARRSESSERTHFVALWTEESFNVEVALPDGGEAEAGGDLPGVPRAPGMHRVLTAWEDGREDRIALYRGGEMSGWELESYFARTLAAEGWTIAADDDDDRDDGTRRNVLAMRDGRQLYVMLDTDELGQGEATMMLTE